MENGRSSILSFANWSWSHDFLVFIVILVAYVFFVIVFGDTKWATSVIPIIERVSRFIPTAIVLTIVIETLRHKIMGLIRDLLREEDKKNGKSIEKNWNRKLGIAWLRKLERKPLKKPTGCGKNGTNGESLLKKTIKDFLILRLLTPNLPQG